MQNQALLHVIQKAQSPGKIRHTRGHEVLRGTNYEQELSQCLRAEAESTAWLPWRLRFVDLRDQTVEHHVRIEPRPKQHHTRMTHAARALRFFV
jgi:hypothetical protein